MSTSSANRAAAPARRLWGAGLCGYLGLGATLQTLPPFMTSRFGAGPLLAGTAVSIAFAATALARPLAGRAADVGRARPVVMAGGFLGTLGGAGHLWAPDVPVVLVSRLVMGAGEGALFSGAMGWVLAGAAPERQGRVAGWFGLSMWSGLAVGPVLADVLRAQGGFRGVWLGVIALSFASAVLVMATPAQLRPAASLPPRLTGWRDLVPRGAALTGTAFGLSSYGYGTITALLILYLRHDSLGGGSIGLALFAAAFLLARGLGSPLADRLGGPPVALVSLTAEAAGLALIAGIPDEAAALSGTVLAGAGVALLFPSGVAITLRRAGPMRLGTAVGVMTSFWDLGIMVAGPVGGLVASSGQYRISFASAVAMTAAAIALVAALSVAGWHDAAGDAAAAGAVAKTDGLLASTRPHLTPFCKPRPRDR
jgi:MFS family permease